MHDAYQLEADVFDDLGPDYIDRWYMAKINANLVHFSRYHKVSAYKDLAAAEKIFLETKYGNIGPHAIDDPHFEGEDSEAMFKLRAQGNVLMNSMEARWRSTDKRVPRIDKNFHKKSHDHLPSGDLSKEKNKPFCKGKLIQKPSIKYPKSAKSVGRIYVGASEFKVDLNEDGRVINPILLAVFPQQLKFDSKNLDRMKKWYWKPNKDQELTKCRLDRKNIVLPFQFVLK